MEPYERHPPYLLVPLRNFVAAWMDAMLPYAYVAAATATAADAAAAAAGPEADKQCPLWEHALRKGMSPIFSHSKLSQRRFMHLHISAQLKFWTRTV